MNTETANKVLDKGFNFFSWLPDRLWKTFCLPPLLTLLGLFGAVIVVSQKVASIFSSNVKQKSGEGGMAFGIGLFAMLAAFVLVACVAIPLSFLGGISFWIIAPITYWVSLAVICNLM